MFNSQQFKEICNKKGFTLERIARELGINSATLYRKMSGDYDTDFTRAEIQNLSRILSMTNKEVKSIFFAD